MKSILFVALMGMPLVGCASAPGLEDGIGTEEGELRALGTTEIIGTIKAGQTLGPIAYTNSPLYRAYRLDGRAGDKVDAWVRCADGDARAWLVDASFRNVVKADDSEGTTDAHLVATLNHTGVFYIVFREKMQDDATFQVSLNPQATPTCDPEEENCGTANPGVVNVRGKDREMKLGYDNTVLRFGSPLIQAQVSFDVAVDTNDQPYVDVVMGNTVVHIPGGTHKSFDHIEGAVEIHGNARIFGARARVTNIVYHIASTHPERLDEQALSAKYAPADTTAGMPAVLGENMPGNKFTFKASAKVYKNWTNDLGCTRVTFNGVELASGETRTLSLAAPVYIGIQRSCFASRASNLENASYDGRVFISDLTVEAP